MKDHVARDRLRPDFGVWPYYEGLFAVTTLYYTCAYFQCAREVRYSQPFLRDNPVFNEQLNKHLASVSNALVWDAGESGIWDPLQEVIGERFAVNGVRLSYEGMCADLDCDDPRRRGYYLRPLDLFRSGLTSEKCLAVQNKLGDLVGFLDSNDLA